MAEQVTQASLPQSSGPGPALPVARFLVSLPQETEPVNAAPPWAAGTHPAPRSAPRHPGGLPAFIYSQLLLPALGFN